MSHGPLMIDIAGTRLAELERERLHHPLIGGVILFSRNYASRDQLQALCAEIHALRQPPLLIAVDHEGGRVQRFREGFTVLPAMRELGAWWSETPRAALECTRDVGYLMAAELRALGIDLSFAPVLDLDWGRSGVIGNRAFHVDPEAVTALAGAFIDGMRMAGMACCGKHFPGHGWVEADSHLSLPVDERDLDEMSADLMPYRRLRLDSVMPAHVIYPSIDYRPAGFSPVWLGLLRQELGFDGVIFSDDLSMEGASFAGGILDRAQAAWDAGCDMLLVCNAPEAVGQVLADWNPEPDAEGALRINRLLPTQSAITADALSGQEMYLAGRAVIQRLAGVAPVSRRG